MGTVRVLIKAMLLSARSGKCKGRWGTLSSTASSLVEKHETLKLRGGVSIASMEWEACRGIAVWFHAQVVGRFKGGSRFIYACVEGLEGRMMTLTVMQPLIGEAHA